MTHDDLPSCEDLEHVAHRFYGAWVRAAGTLAQGSRVDAESTIETLRLEVIGLLTFLQPRAADAKQQRQRDLETMLRAFARLLPVGTEVKITPPEQTKLSAATVRIPPSTATLRI